MEVTGKIFGINGPIIQVKGNDNFKMSEMVTVGNDKLVGEVISIALDKTTVQVYEDTSGLRPGEIVESTGGSLSVTLGPGRYKILDGTITKIDDK